MMLKLNIKLGFAASAIAASALLLTACGAGSAPSKASIDGGVMYPIENGKTKGYMVNEATLKGGYSFGRVPTANELAKWDTDIMPDGTGLPEGSGNAEDGSELYDAKCGSCHGDFGSGGGGYPSLGGKGAAADLRKTLMNQRVDGNDDGATRLFGSYWPEASTLFWYIKDAMPHQAPDSLTTDEVYQLVAFVLNANEMSIDGVEVDEEYELNREKFLKIKMLNKDGFEPSIDGPQGPENVRKFYSVPSNYGAIKVNPAERCMTNCQEPTVSTVYIQNGGINDFHPEMNTKRDMPVLEEVAIDPKKVYANSCAMCHSGYLSPGSDEWAGFLKKGMKKVYANAIHGTQGGMPAKGGTNLSDSNFKLVVDYITTGK